MKMQVTTPVPAFKPVTVELTFESIEELLVLKTALGMTKSDTLYETVVYNGEETSCTSEATCGSIAWKQFDFFDELYKSLTK